MMRGLILAVVVAALSVASAQAQEFNIVIRNNAFEPQEIRVPAGKRVSIYVSNEDASAEEFESPALKVEKVIPGKSKGLVRVGPLAPGRYEFFGEFHPNTAKGVVIAE
ncbi:MAG TPA: cupredoxin domain-containing protein [Xanthobacteraceae bacterium]|jgi:plastocyanin|nr:cupredoxin domain-containing protein [Xanthobacteraceae bacterium]